MKRKLSKQNTHNENDVLIVDIGDEYPVNRNQPIRKIQDDVKETFKIP